MTTIQLSQNTAAVVRRVQDKFNAYETESVKFGKALYKLKAEGTPRPIIRREISRQLLQLFQVRKLYGWDVDELSKHKEVGYTFLDADVAELQQENGLWFLRMGKHIREFPLEIKIEEYIDALSIPVRHWPELLATECSYMQLLEEFADPVIQKQVSIAQNYREDYDKMYGVAERTRRRLWRLVN